LRQDSEKERTARIAALRLQLGQIDARLGKLADALIDGTLEKDLFTKQQGKLLLEQAGKKEQLAQTEEGLLSGIETLEKTVELAKSPSILYKTGSPERKRELLKTLLSNLSVSEKNVEMTLALPFRIIAERQKTSDGGPYRGTCRTWEDTINILKDYFEHTASGENLKTS